MSASPFSKGMALGFAFLMNQAHLCSINYKVSKQKSLDSQPVYINLLVLYVAG